MNQTTPMQRWRLDGQARLSWMSLAAAAALLSACGGGGGSSSTDSTAQTPAAVQTAAVPVRVIDGPIRNALVCLDTNLNNKCDSGEPSGRTDGTGNVTLSVNAADAGKYPVLAIVGQDAVDVDNGPVTVPFLLKAPADQPAVVSPLTTLVQNTVESTGGKTAEAAAAVQAQIGTTVSLFQDFTKDSSTEGKKLGAIARMAVVTQQQQSDALKTTVGTQTVDGKTITQDDLDKLVLARLNQILPNIVQALSDSAVQAALKSGSLDDLNKQLLTQAKALVADANIGLQPSGVAVAVAVASGADSSATTPSPSMQLAALTFSDASNWYRRLITTSAAQAVPDADNNIRYGDNRLRSTTGTQAAWSYGSSPDRQSDLHWNGKSWVACAVNQPSLSKVRDSQGRSSYNYCDGIELGTSTRSVLDVAGKKMLDVYNQARAAGYTNLFIANPATALGNATFPADSKAYFQTNAMASTAPAYSPNLSSIVRLASTKALRNGDATTCAGITPATLGGTYLSEPSTLEDMIAAATGTPCVYAATTFTGASLALVSSGPRNEWWGATTLNIGVVGDAPLMAQVAASTYYTTNAQLRVAFGANSAVTYLSCMQRIYDGSPRNCDVIGTGTYSISTVGDARVLRLNAPPVQLGQFNYERLFVERGGKVYFGFQTRPSTSIVARLNTQAGNALLTQLGLPTGSPESTVTLNAGSFAGDWVGYPVSFTDTWMNANAALIRLPLGDSAIQCYDASATTAITTQQRKCSLTLDPATGLLSGDMGGTAISVTLDIVKGSGTGTATDTTGSVPVAIRRR